MRVHFVSLGCDKNLMDSEIMLGIINEEGHEITQNDDEADVIIVNTCGFIADANEEGVNTILELAQNKVDGVCKALIVTGCMAQRYKKEIFKELPEVDAIVGVGDFQEIGRVIREVSAQTGQKIALVGDNTKEIDEKYLQKRVLSTPSYLAYLKISEGCDNHCTYCTIPSIRGKYRSRKLVSLVEEAEGLAAKGVKELILIAQDTALYGKDIYGEVRLHVLLSALSQIQGIEWIRTLYCYPEHLTDETITQMSQNPKVCHYLDMPVQHSNDGVLKRMGRKGSREDLIQVIGKLRKSMPDICLRTTLIVGFPGETEEEFQDLSDFVKEIGFDRLGVFEYSREEGTTAYNMKDQIEDDVKSRRKDHIMALQQDISAKKCTLQVGKVINVIVDGFLPEDGVYCGRGYMDCYEIDGMVFFTSDYELISGGFVKVKITESSEYDLKGVIYYEST